MKPPSVLTLRDTLNRAGSATVGQLSQTLNAPERMVRAVVEHLERTGRVKQVSEASGCLVGGQCKYCPESKGCTPSERYEWVR